MFQKPARRHFLRILATITRWMLSSSQPIRFGTRSPPLGQSTHSLFQFSATKGNAYCQVTPRILPRLPFRACHAVSRRNFHCHFPNQGASAQRPSPFLCGHNTPGRYLAGSVTRPLPQPTRHRARRPPEGPPDYPTLPPRHDLSAERPKTVHASPVRLPDCVAM
jgi:hypothetical protein